jgi:hypothetical protein
MGKLINNFGNYNVAGKSILVVDQGGNVLIPVQPFPTRGK